VVQLQKPKYAYYQGAVRPWEGAMLHVGCQGVYLGLNVFEGLKAYWQPDGSMGVVALRRHYERLKRSARLLHFPFEMGFGQFENAVHEIIESLCVPEQDIWVRATLYIVEGFWGEDQKTDLFLTAFLSQKAAPQPIRVGVSTWRRASDVVLPARIKTSTNYQVARLAKIEGRPRGYSEMILLNASDRVAEGAGTCLLMVRDGAVSTPPASEGALESITVDIVEALAKDLSLPFERRPIDRSELYIADELALVGSLAEVTLVLGVDGNECSYRTQILQTLSERYRDAVKGIKPHRDADLSVRKYSKNVA
jgi:branched-chain amino acid aminotransferase